MTSHSKDLPGHFVVGFSGVENILSRKGTAGDVGRGDLGKLVNKDAG